MIARYARPVMTALWSDERRYATWLEVELSACAAMEEVSQGPVPAGTAQRLRQGLAEKGPLSPERILAIEAQTQHDVIAFLTHVEELLGPEARFLHLGLTSSDVLDTSLAILLRDAADLILNGLEQELLPALKEQALRHRHTVMIGRSHGIHAEPITCGLVFAGSYAEVSRAARRLRRAREQVAVGKLSGAVGVYGSGCTSPEVERRALSALGLSPETVSTQVVPRDRHAELFLSIALVGSAIERLALTVRHWQRTEVGEAQEPFGKKQKGSSAMPHKKNPVLSENLCGLARLLRTEASSSLENIALWHERDISHSSVERIIAPNITTLGDFMVQRAAGLVRGLVVKPERMLHNMELTRSLCFSEKVMLALVAAGLGRQAAYELVQRHALQVVAEAPGSFRERLLADPEVQAHLSAEQIDACFDLSRHLRHVDEIFARTFGGA